MNRRRKALLAGAIFAVLTSASLLVAVAAYPSPDNLALGLLVWILFGVDALGQMTVADAAASAIAQVALAFLLGYVIGRVATRPGARHQ